MSSGQLIESRRDSERTRTRARPGRRQCESAEKFLFELVVGEEMKHVEQLGCGGAVSALFAPGGGGGSTGVSGLFMMG